MTTHCWQMTGRLDKPFIYLGNRYCLIIHRHSATRWGWYMTDGEDVLTTGINTGYPSLSTAKLIAVDALTEWEALNEQA